MIDWLLEFWANCNAVFHSSFAAWWVSLSVLIFVYMSCRWWWRGLRADLAGMGYFVGGSLAAGMSSVPRMLKRAPTSPPPTALPATAPDRVVDAQGEVWVRQPAPEAHRPPVIIRR